MEDAETSRTSMPRSKLPPRYELARAQEKDEEESLRKFEDERKVIIEEERRRCEGGTAGSFKSRNTELKNSSFCLHFPRDSFDKTPLSAGAKLFFVLCSKVDCQSLSLVGENYTVTVHPNYF